MVRLARPQRITGLAFAQPGRLRDHVAADRDLFGMFEVQRAATDLRWSSNPAYPADPGHHDGGEHRADAGQTAGSQPGHACAAPYSTPRRTGIGEHDRRNAELGSRRLGHAVSSGHDVTYTNSKNDPQEHQTSIQLEQSAKLDP